MHFTLQPASRDVRKETYGFKSTINPLQVKELKPFEDDIYSLIANIKYKPAVGNRFQETMKAG